MPPRRVWISLTVLIGLQTFPFACLSWAGPNQDHTKKNQKPGASSSAGSTTPETTAGADKKAQAQKTAQFEGRLAKIFDPSKVDLSDYVPCHFTVSELLQLRPAPPTPRLTGAEAEALKDQVEAEAFGQQQDGFLDAEGKSEFVHLVANADFEGMTPSAALATVIGFLRQVDRVRLARTNPETTLKLFETSPVEGLGVLASVAPNSAPISDDAAAKIADAARDVAAEKSGLGKEKGQQFFTKYRDDLLGNIKGKSPGDALQALTEESSKFVGQIQERADTAAKEAAAPNAKPEGKQEAQKNADAANKDVQAATKGIEAVNTTATNLPSPAKANEAIIGSARSTIEAFKRPPDIGCAMSILSWNETRYEYGRLLANEYVGVQVVVRNLSETQEFVLHDAAFAVDTDLNGRRGRFFSGRDKLIVRGMSAADADFSPRNIVVHTLESVGTLMSAVIPVAGTSFSAAASVYNSGFLQGLHKTWPDHNTDHLNLLNDTGFSSATAYKSVVPKSGTVMFVIFVPAKQFEQGWWAQSCAQTISNGVLLNSSESSKSSPPTNVLKVNDEVGINLKEALKACQNGGGDQSNKDTDHGEPSTPVQSGTKTPFNVVHYKNWSPNALAIFRELAFTVVAGVHINEASQNKPGTSAVDCPEDSEGKVDFTKRSGGSVSCDIKGQNLDQIAKLRLRNSADQTDSKTAEGDVSVNGDAKAAKVSFPLSQVGPLDGAVYKVFLVTKEGVESDGGQKLQFSRAPFVNSSDIQIDLAKDLDKDQKKKIDLPGYHLDKTTTVHLEGGSPVIKLDFPIAQPTSALASFTFDGSKLDKGIEFAKPVELKITLMTSDKANPSVDSQIHVVLSGKITPLTNPAPATGTGNKPADRPATTAPKGGAKPKT